MRLGTSRADPSPRPPSIDSARARGVVYAPSATRQWTSGEAVLVAETTRLNPARSGIKKPFHLGNLSDYLEAGFLQHASRAGIRGMGECPDFREL